MMEASDFGKSHGPVFSLKHAVPESAWRQHIQAVCMYYYCYYYYDYLGKAGVMSSDPGHKGQPCGRDSELDLSLVALSLSPKVPLGIGEMPFDEAQWNVVIFVLIHPFDVVIILPLAMIAMIANGMVSLLVKEVGITSLHIEGITHVRIGIVGSCSGMGKSKRTNGFQPRLPWTPLNMSRVSLRKIEYGV